MALTRAQLMTTPNGTGAIPNFPGSVKAGSNITISGDGTISSSGGSGGITQVVAGTGLSGGGSTATVQLDLKPGSATAIGGVKSGTGISIAADGTISATGSGGVVNSITANNPLTGGGSAATVTIGFDTATTSLTKYLQLTGGTLTGNTSLTAATGKFTVTSSTGPGANNAPLMISTARTDWSWIGYFFNTRDTVGVTLRSYNTGASVDSSFSNQVTNEDNCWLYSARQCRLNGNVSGAIPVMRVAVGTVSGSTPKYVATLSNTGTWSVGAPNPTEVVANFNAGLSNLLGVEPVTYIAELPTCVNPTPGQPNDTWVAGPTASSAPTVGFTAQNLLENFPEAVFWDDEDSQYYINTLTLTAGLVNSVQTLNAQNQALQDQITQLQTQLQDYILTHP